VTDRNEVTTLGRGGSDTTAVALAAALEAESCVIYTDVDGVYSADPRIVPRAVKLEELRAAEMEELAWHGAQVLKAEAVEFAGTNSVPVVVRSTFKDDSCTVVHPGGEDRDVYRPRRSEVAGVSGRKDLVRISIRAGETSRPKREELFAEISQYDLIFGSMGSTDESSDLFISNQEIPDPEALKRDLELKFDGSIKIAGDLGAVTLVGFGLGSKPEALLDAIRILERQKAPLVKSFSGRESLTFIIPRSEVDESVRGMHRVFVEERQPARVLTAGRREC
jgi:aspartate kinase